MPHTVKCFADVAEDSPDLFSKFLKHMFITDSNGRQVCKKTLTYMYKKLQCISSLLTAIVLQLRLNAEDIYKSRDITHLLFR